MITLEATRARGRQALTSASLAKGALQACDTALSRPGRLYSAFPIASRLFLGWSAALLPAVPTTWLPAAVACEFVLAACDLVDRHTDGNFATDREERSALQKQGWELPAGISLFLLAHELLSEVETSRARTLTAMHTVGRISRRALAAHHRDGVLRAYPAARPEDALTVLRWRSGELFALPCVCAAILAGTSSRSVVLARRFGRALGCAGQLEDDLADRRDDARSGRKTLPLLLPEVADDDGELADAATSVLVHRFLEDAASALRQLPPLVYPSPCNCEALWSFLPEELRCYARSLPV